MFFHDKHEPGQRVVSSVFEARSVTLLNLIMEVLKVGQE